MRFILTCFLSVAFYLFIFPSSHAQLEPSYTSDKPSAVTYWYEWVTPESRRSDRDFIAGMRPHHAGALTMSEEYLAHPDALSPVLKKLSRGIIHNQEFEIRMLDTVERMLEQHADREGLLPVALRGLAQRQKFVRAPMPGPLDNSAPQHAVSVADVKFAKAMIVHHEGALIMCNDYLADPRTNNGYLELMCVDILLDQAQEIALMQRIIDNYPGDSDTIKLDPSMIYGMEGMMHHHGAGHH